MSRESRTLLLLGVFALGAVAVLGSMAKRYGAMLDTRHAPPGAPSAGFERVVPLPDAPRAVARFADVRATMRRAVEQRTAEATIEETLIEARDLALRADGMGAQRYATVRSAYRRWRIGAPVPDGLSSAFESRAAELETVDLGAYESLDR